MERSVVDDIRKDPLAAALRAVVEEAIAESDLEQLAVFADVVYDRATPVDGQITPMHLALYYAVREARGHIAGDRHTADRVDEARKRRDGESDEEYRARMKVWGLSGDDDD